MSLGLFNCRLIQPAGDQLFFFSAVLPRRCVRAALFSLLVTRPARPRPAGGRRMLPVFPSQKAFVLVFRGAKSRRMQKGSLPPIHPRISPKIPNPTHRFCYRTRKTKRRILKPAAPGSSEWQSPVARPRSHFDHHQRREIPPYY